MVTVVAGKNRFEGELEGYNNGSAEFHIQLSDDVLIILSAKSQGRQDMFTAMGRIMNQVGLQRLRNSVIDFNKGAVNILDGNDTVNKKLDSIASVNVGVAK